MVSVYKGNHDKLKQRLCSSVEGDIEERRRKERRGGRSSDISILFGSG